MAGVRYSTGIADNGGRRTAARSSVPDRAEKPTSSRVTGAIGRGHAASARATPPRPDWPRSAPARTCPRSSRSLPRPSHQARIIESGEGVGEPDQVLHGDLIVQGVAISYDNATSNPRRSVPMRTAGLVVRRSAGHPGRSFGPGAAPHAEVPRTVVSRRCDVRVTIRVLVADDHAAIRCGPN